MILDNHVQPDRDAADKNKNLVSIVETQAVTGRKRRSLANERKKKQTNAECMKITRQELTGWLPCDSEVATALDRCAWSTRRQMA